MNRFRVRTPSRLHFGLLSWGSGKVRQFGGIGLMIDTPGLVIRAEPARDWSAEGPLAGRVLEVASRVATQGRFKSSDVEPARFVVEQAPPEHVGLGVGTQLSLGVARLLAGMAGGPEPTVEQLAWMAGRGLRSGIGLHGFGRGGLVVDGGRGSSGGIPPLLAQVAFPADWSVLVVIPPRESGLHGAGEIRAFAELPPFPDALTDRLCRLVLLGLLPAAIERDLARFGGALEELQQGVGQGFAPAQGGIFARPELESLAAILRVEGLHGVGQSSWGPTLYGFSEASAGDRAALRERLLTRTGLPGDSVFWTFASVHGASITSESTDPAA